MDESNGSTFKLQVFQYEVWLKSQPVEIIKIIYDALNRAKSEGASEVYLGTTFFASSFCPNGRYDTKLLERALDNYFCQQIVSAPALWEGIENKEYLDLSYTINYEKDKVKIRVFLTDYIRHSVQNELANIKKKE